MDSSRMSRRLFVQGLGAVTLSLSGCETPPFQLGGSPFDPGPYRVVEAELGVPLILNPPYSNTSSSPCNDGSLITTTHTGPNPCPTMIYFPDPDQTSGPAPLVIFSHARRDPTCIQDIPSGGDPTLADFTQDFKRYKQVLTHLASHGCVVVAPDLSWLAGSYGGNQRADVIVAVWKFFKDNSGAVPYNGGLKTEEVDPSRVMLAGHSTGGGACFRARTNLAAAGGPPPLAISVLAPAADMAVLDLVDDPPSYGILVMKGTNDTASGNIVPDAVFNMGGQNRRVLVTLEGANHFGYTDLCSENGCFPMPFVGDGPCDFGPDRQKNTAGAYLAAMMRRFAHNDVSMNQYLTQAPLNEPDVTVVASPTSW